ncbi:MAG: hypothetical protein IJN42_04760 [Clostridia bacterium]|nr:hypothetical protein [Clostridia bacterium]
MKKTLSIFLLAAVLLLSGCNQPGYEQTETTQAAVAAYIAAVKESVAAKGGTVSVNIHMKDTVVSKADSTQRYEYTYTVENENDEHFDYRCFDGKGKLLNHYKTVDENGVGKVIDQISGEESDQFASYLRHNKNPISTLQLFRMDAGYRLQHSAISAISMEEKDGAQIITVEFHGNKLTNTVIRSENGLNRTVTSHKRIYTLREGKIAKIEIYDRENVHYKEETGTMDTDTVVEVNYTK